MKLPVWAKALDAVAIIMAILAISVAIAGGFRIVVFDVRISVTDWWRPALWSLIALGIRHAIIRHDPFPQRVVAGIRRWWQSPDTRIVLPIHLSSRLGVILVGFLAVILIGFPPEAEKRWRIYDNDLLDLPGRWDTGWYLSIANEGYLFQPDGEGGLSAEHRLLSRVSDGDALSVSAVLGRQPLWTGVGISIVAFYFALVYFLRLARSELGDEDQAVTAVMLLAAYPFAVFFSAAYTESLFLLTLLGAVYHFRQNQLWRSAFWGFVCGLTRPPGCFLSIVLGLMAVAPMWDARAMARNSCPPPNRGGRTIGRRAARRVGARARHADVLGVRVSAHRQRLPVDDAEPGVGQGVSRPGFDCVGPLRVHCQQRSL